MYRYDAFDRRLVHRRVAEFRDQTRRFLAGELTEDEFRPLRLRNGLYLQKHAPMLRIAVPYGMLSSRQLRALADVARRYDRGYGHFTTRQNLQLNWPKLEQVPDILNELAEVEMHSIQTSGNCIRNTTTDHFAGVAGDEIADPRPYCELIRQWSTLHPEFSWLPRKFKIAVSGATTDRAATLVHDIGLYAVRGADGGIGFRVIVGGGLGRTPMIGHVIRDFIPEAELLNYLEAILRVYNRHGRRDNIFKARIKILVKERTPQRFAAEVEAEWEQIAGGPGTVPAAEIARLAAFFSAPAYETARRRRPGLSRCTRRPSRVRSLGAAQRVRGTRCPAMPSSRSRSRRRACRRATSRPTRWTRSPISRSATASASCAYRTSRTSSSATCARATSSRCGRALKPLGLATPNIGLLTDIVCCPGGDFCSLANAKSIPIAEAIQRRFDDLDFLHDIGDIELNMSGCMNACGHHHVGNIGILGVDKNGSEWYQVSLGGAQGEHAALGKVIGPSFAAHEMPDVVARILDVYVARRHDDEAFIDTVRRIGIEPFKEHVYAEAHQA